MNCNTTHYRANSSSVPGDPTVGLRNLVYDTPAWRVAAHVQGHYAWDLSDQDTNYNLWDVDGGVTLSRKIKIDQQLTIMPYAGPVLSIVRLDGDNDLSADEKNVLGAAAGVSLLMREMNTIRVEARYFDDFSVSAAAGIAF